MTPAQVKRLFGRPRSRLTMKYRELDDELRAIASGDKELSFFDMTLEELHGQHTFGEILALASKLDLRVVLRPREPEKILGKTVRMAAVYVARADQLWRVPAFEMLHEQARGWPEFAEAAVSRLAGYSEADIDAWIEQCHQRGAYEHHVFVALTPAQRRAMADTGDRCLPAGIGSVTAFCLWWPGVIRDKAKLPGKVIARMLMSHAVLRELFPHAPGSAVAIRELDDDDRVKLNGALRGDQIEIWNGRTWK